MCPARSPSESSLMFTDARYRAVLHHLGEERDRIIDQTVTRVREQIRSYLQIPVFDLRTAVAHNVDIGIQTLSVDTPVSQNLNEFQRRVRTRADQGLPIEDMLRGMRLSFEVLDQSLEAFAEQENITTEQLLISARRLWEAIGTMTNQAALAYQDHQIEAMWKDVEERSQFLQRLATGVISPEKLAAESIRYGIDPNKDEFVAFRANAVGDSSDRLRHDLERSSRTAEHRALIGYFTGDLIGIAPRRPPALPGLILGVGPATTLSDIADSFQVADKAFNVADRAGVPGVYGTEELTWRLVAGAEPAVSEILVRKYRTPLDSEGEFGRLLEHTLRAFLQHDRDLSATATHLHIHVNTARYRVNRFCELTGVSVNSSETLVELMLLFEQVPAYDTRPQQRR